jgi:hypothetical protein
VAKYQIFFNILV